MTHPLSLLGTLFGFVLSRSGAADYDFIQGMFLFERFQLYGIIGTAVVLTAPGLWRIKRRGRTLSGAPLAIEPKPLHRGNVVGGVLFGVGWSIAGMCPGPILVNIGEGKLYAVAALAGALVGAALFGLALSDAADAAAAAAAHGRARARAERTRLDQRDATRTERALQRHQEALNRHDVPALAALYARRGGRGEPDVRDRPGRETSPRRSNGSSVFPDYTVTMRDPFFIC